MGLSKLSSFLFRRNYTFSFIFPLIYYIISFDFYSTQVHAWKYYQDPTPKKKNPSVISKFGQVSVWNLTANKIGDMNSNPRYITY